MRPQLRHPIRIQGIIKAIVISFITLYTQVQAAPLYQFSPPVQITLKVYALRENGAILLDGNNNPILCESTSLIYGCTYYDGNNGRPFDPSKAYPFTSDTITINFEGDTTTATDNSQQGYLHNVISQEMAEGSPLSSYTAQAIAARTYAYFQTSGGTVTIDNSASKQVYLPYRFEGLGGSADRKTKVRNAITLPGPLYMTLPNSDQPINAHFGADNCLWTENKISVAPYLKSIYDPISETDNPAPCLNSDPQRGTPNGGMGSNGASRWGYGNTDESNQGNLWSVQWGKPPEIIDGDSWQNAFQILIHYFSGVTIRDGSGQPHPHPPLEPADR